MTRLPEPLAFASEARTAFWLLILSLVGFVAWTHAALLYAALFAVVFSSIWYLNQHRLRRKYREKAATDATEDENAVLLLAKSREVPLERVVYTRDIRDSRSLTFIDRNKATLVLGGLFRILRRRSPAVSDSIIFHEFGHIANRDIRITQLARTIVATTLVLALWDAVMSLTGFPRLFLTQHVTVYRHADVDIIGSWLTNWSPVLRNTLLPFLIPLVMTIIYKQFLRDREFAADRISSNLGGHEGLIRTFSGGAAKQRVLPNPFASHPRPERRTAAVVDLEPYRLPSPFTLGLLGYLTGFGMTLVLLISIGSERSGLGTISPLADALFPIVLIFAMLAAANHWERSFSLSAFLKASGWILLMRTLSGSLCFFLGMCLGGSWLGPLVFALADNAKFRQEIVRAFPILAACAAFFALVLPVQSMATAAILRYTEGAVRPKFTLAIVRACTLLGASIFLGGAFIDAMRHNLLPAFVTDGFKTFAGKALEAEQGSLGFLLGVFFRDVLDMPQWNYLTPSVVFLAVAALLVFFLYRGRRAARRKSAVTEEESRWPEWMVRPITHQR